MRLFAISVFRGAGLAAHKERSVGAVWLGFPAILFLMRCFLIVVAVRLADNPHLL